MSVVLFGTPHGGVSSKQEDGMILITDRESGAEAGSSTLMCRHCQFHMRIVPGSGRQRGWCARCDGPLCGKQACLERCEPFERAIERMEGRLSLAAKLDRMITG